MSTNRQKQIAFARQLVAIGENIVATRASTLGREAIEFFRAEVKHENTALIGDDTPRIIRAEAVALIELMADLTYARADKDRPRDNRLCVLIAQCVVCIQTDIIEAEAAAKRGLS